MVRLAKFWVFLALAAGAAAWNQGLFERMKNPEALKGDTCAGKKFCVVVYLAPWCPHCRAHLAQTQTLLQKSQVGDVGVRVIVGMGQGGQSRVMADKIAQNIVTDDEKKIASYLGVENVPAYVVLDSDGAKVLDGHEGFAWAAEKFRL